jgi:hypothetical protein
VTTSRKKKAGRQLVGRRRPKASNHPRPATDSPRTARKKKERTGLRSVLAHVYTRPNGRKVTRARWNEARCIRWANEVLAQDVGRRTDEEQALRSLEGAAKESPGAISAKAKAAVLQAEGVLGTNCAGMFRCFQLRAQAALAGAQDLRSLGYSPSVGLTNAYVREIGGWRSVLPTATELDEAAENAERTASAGLLSVLPRSSADPGSETAKKQRWLTPQQYEGWKSDMRLVCRVQLIHDRALRYREEYLRLSKGKLPSADRFRGELDARLRVLTAEEARSTQHAELRCREAHAIVALEELLKDLASSRVLRRAKVLRTHLVSLQGLLSETDHGTQHETTLQLDAAWTIAMLNGVLEPDESGNCGSIADCQEFLVELRVALCASPHQIHLERLEQAIGSSAADASRWRLNTLKWRLQGADFVLRPLGSYLSEWRAPKQLQARYALDVGLRDRLGARYTDFAKSKAIAAAFTVYAGSVLGPAGGIEEGALNTIEKLRGRISRVEAREELSELREWRDMP